MRHLQDFFVFLKQRKVRLFDFSLSLLIFSLLPVKNFYTDLKLDIQQPVFRQFDIFFPRASLYPVNATGVQTPMVTATSFLIIDVDSKAILAAKNQDKKLFPASTTKIMTALVSLDFYHLTDVLEVKEIKHIGQEMGLEKGERLTAESLLYGLLVKSGNDAAYVLAQNYPGGMQKFIEAMNQKAKELHLFQTQFVNPAGIDNQLQFTSSHDLAILASEAMEKPVFRKIVATPKITVTDVTGERKYFLENVNKLLTKVIGLKGVKTGWTEKAGECLVTYTERQGRKIITVVLGSKDRFGESKKLINWVFTNYQWRALTNLRKQLELKQ